MADDIRSVGEPSYTIDEFCALERMSPPTYHKMRNHGYGPDELRPPGTNIVRVTAEARRAWHERMQQLANDPKVQKRKRKLRSHARKAGKLSAKSERHVSKQLKAAAQARARERERAVR